MNISSATRDRFPYQNEPTWSKSEKAIAAQLSTLLWVGSFSK
jgi:hypothetical protein